MASENSEEDVLDTTERASKSKNEEDHPTLTCDRRGLVRPAQRFEFGILSAELSDLDEVEEYKPYDHGSPNISRGFESVTTRSLHRAFWNRVVAEQPADDRYFDMSEDKMLVVTAKGVTKIAIPSLQECQKHLRNEEAEKHREKTVKLSSRVKDLLLKEFSALWIWFITMCCLESIVVIANAAIATFVFCKNAEAYAVKLDFHFLAFAVIFPLTFLLESTFGRRERAISSLADFKGAVLSTALMTLTVDWPGTDGDLTKGRLGLPEQFNANVLKDFQQLVQLVYQSLSMPNVSHAWDIIFWSEKQQACKRVHALQNNIAKQIHDIMFDLTMHIKEMKKYGFPAGEASRLYLYHQLVQQLLGHLRSFKYYRTPQATRAFGRAYILILPWLCGPYFAWVYTSTNYNNYHYPMILAALTFLIVFGLLNAQQGMEDPFVADFSSWLPGIDNVKLDYEMAVMLQTIEQYYMNAKLQRTFEIHKKSNFDSEEPAESMTDVSDP